MMDNVIVIDVETSSLDTKSCIPVEIAAVTLHGDKIMEFVPYHTDSQIALADPESLNINGYYKRDLKSKALSISQTWQKYMELRDLLNGRTFVGSNPWFDKRVLEKEMVQYDLLEPGVGLGSAVFDVRTFASGGLGYAKKIGMSLACKRLGIPVQKQHTAIGDAVMTAQVLRELLVRL